MNELQIENTDTWSNPLFISLGKDRKTIELTYTEDGGYGTHILWEIPLSELLNFLKSVSEDQRNDK